MKSILICGVGPHQRALAHRLHAIHPLSAIATVKGAASKRQVRRRLASAAVGWPFALSWRRMMRHYDRLFPSFPIESTIHRSANSEKVRKLIGKMKPDLVLVSGTDLLREPIISAVQGRIMNLHTGISPYIKGAPNCTNWALALGEFGLIGNTILWLDAGVDSGNIIATERTALTGKESLYELHRKVMEHAHDLYGRAYRKFVAGDPLPSVPQATLGKGRLFLARQWTAARMLQATKNFYFRFRSRNISRGRSSLISLDMADSSA